MFYSSSGGSTWHGTFLWRQQFGIADHRFLVATAYFPAVPESHFGIHTLTRTPGSPEKELRILWHFQRISSSSSDIDGIQIEKTLTFPFGRVVPGHNGLVASNSGMLSICGVSDWPLQGRCNRCGLTSTQRPVNGLKRLCWCSVIFRIHAKQNNN